MEVILGLGGHRHHACAALVVKGTLAAAIEQERVTRVRAAGPNASGLPDEAVDLLLAGQRLNRSDVDQIAYAEPFQAFGWSATARRFELHQGHASTAFLTSQHDTAAILVDDGEGQEQSWWLGRAGEITRLAIPYPPKSIAQLYVECASALGFEGPGRTQRCEALARLQPHARDPQIDALFAIENGEARYAADWQGTIAQRRSTAEEGSPASQALAASVQARLADLLLEQVRALRQAVNCNALCLGGSLFHNTFFTSVVRRSGVFDEIFVPFNPGAAGLALGSALRAANAPARQVSPFLGPAFSVDEIKATLDNCKLSYELLNEGEAIEQTVAALQRGHLVGWFEGAMEWGPRALGARSILASPFSPYVLENLNRFLKHRQPWRGYALSGLTDEVGRLFEGPERSVHMEFDYLVRDRELFRHVLPTQTAALRVQTVGADAPPRFRSLLHAFREATGTGVLVNTSFNGFSEPIVCTPRDAVRVYFGTGLDMLMLDRFALAK